MSDKLRQLALKVKEKVHLSQFNLFNKQPSSQHETGENRIYVPVPRVSEIAEKLKYETVRNKVREMVARYEKFTGVEEIMAIQNTVVEAQVCSTNYNLHCSCSLLHYV